ncbi:MAG: hypothetical protein EBT64_06740, partial [Gammaproteobacteria bacterium]|nr:hypothetical protein [Gammaproteobacteria bacterium]
MIAGYNEERRCLGLRPKGAPMDWDFERGFTGAHDILEHHLGVEPIGIIGECWAFGAMLHVRGDGTHFTSEQSMISILSRDLADFCIADDAWELLERPQFAVAPALRAYGDTAYDVPRVLREIAERTTEDV